MVAGTSPAASSATAGSTHSIGLTGLTPATQYSIYCATPHEVVSTALTAYSSGFSSQPTKSNDNAGTTVTVAVTTTVSEQVRCVFVAEGATAPTAANVLAGTGGKFESEGVPEATRGGGCFLVVVTMHLFVLLLGWARCGFCGFCFFFFFLSLFLVSSCSPQPVAVVNWVCLRPPPPPPGPLKELPCHR